MPILCWRRRLSKAPSPPQHRRGMRLRLAPETRQSSRHSEYSKTYEKCRCDDQPSLRGVGRHRRCSRLALIVPCYREQLSAKRRHRELERKRGIVNADGFALGSSICFPAHAWGASSAGRYPGGGGDHRAQNEQDCNQAPAADGRVSRPAEHELQRFIATPAECEHALLAGFLAAVLHCKLAQSAGSNSAGRRAETARITSIDTGSP